jgi:hypothetical protein
MSTEESPAGLTRFEVMRLVNRYIGVHGGYLGDFSYGSHADFYVDYCELDIDPFDFEGGTTRYRFIEILSTRSPRDQAKIIRGILEKYPPGSEPQRTTELAASFAEIASRLERGPMVQAPASLATSEVVRRAIDDVEALLAAGGPTSCVDRVHTALHGHLRHLCQAEGVEFTDDDTTVALLKKLRREHPRLQDLGPREQDIQKILNSAGSILDALNPVRNRASVAHPNTDLLGVEEARLVINIGRTLLSYLDEKLGVSEAGQHAGTTAERTEPPAPASGTAASAGPSLLEDDIPF